MVSKAFLEKLLLKMKTGDARSIHLNALPGRFARLDLHDLIYLDQSLHLRFLRLLLTRSNFELTITIDYKALDKKPPEYAASARTIARKLDSLHYQYQDEFLEHGTRTFAFGYPLLIKRDAAKHERILKAPLITWYLDIRKDLHKGNTWHISSSDEQPVIFNEVLRSHLETYDRILVDDLLHLFEEDVLTESSVTDIARQMLEKLGTTSTERDTELKVLPGTNRETIEKLTGSDPWIRWSGIFGLYKAQKQSIIRDLESLIRSESIPTLRPAATPNGDGEHPLREQVFSAVPIDPSQESIVNGVREFGNILIQGPPGTGKSQSITAMITDNLYRGNTCLVVCEKKTALDVIHENLRAAGLEGLCITIDDIHRDRKKVVDRVRQCLEERAEPPLEFREYDHRELRCERRDKTKRLTDRLHALNTKCFGDDTLTGLIAKLHQLRTASPGTVPPSDPHLQRPEWGYEDYRQLRKVILEGERLFGDLPKSDTLSRLRDALFTADVPETEVFGNVSGMLERTAAILEIFERYKSPPRSRKIFNERTRTNTVRLGLGRWIYPSLRHIHHDRKTLLSTYTELRDTFNRLDYFEYELPEPDGTDRFDELQGFIAELHGILAGLTEGRARFADHSKFRRFLCGLDDPDRRLPEVFSQTIANGKWEAALQIWYYGHFIDKGFERSGIDGNLDQLLDEVDALDGSMTREVGDAVRAAWSKRQRSCYNDRTVAHIKQLYNYRRNKKYGKRNSLRTMIRHDLEMFTETFPVVMVNPTVCSSVLPLEAGSFDCVIFDEASQLRIEDTFAALIRGKSRIISGDRHQMPPSGYFAPQVIFLDENPDNEDEPAGSEFLADSDSLLEYGMDTNFRPEYLDYHYRSRHPDLIAFSNAAFYGNRLIPMPPDNDVPPISYFAVNGTYDHNRTNVGEARAIVDHIYNDIPTDGAGCPSVGIATFNIHQRDLIWDLLMEATYGDDEIAREKAHRLDRLMERGLFVKNLENIQGDERDIILISTTFGPGEDGNFRQSFGPLTRDNGYRLLNVIVSRAKHRLAVFTSVPDAARAGYPDELAEKGNTGKGIFYAYLAYAQAVSNSDRLRMKNILEMLSAHCRERPFQHERQRMPLFLQQLYTLLGERYTPEWVAHNFRFGGFLLELAIVHPSPDGRPAVALMTSCTGNPQPTDYRLLLFKRKMLEEHGIPVLFIDAAAWHLDRIREESRMFEAIDRLLQVPRRD